MPVIGMLHTGLTVSSIERSLAFYVGLLGMRLVHQQEGDNPYTRTLVGLPDAHLKAAFLKSDPKDATLSGHVLELIEYVQPKGKKIETIPCDVASSHLCFLTDDANGLYEKLAPRGVTFVNPPVAITAGINKGGFACYLRDPDGFTLEFLQPPKWRLEGKPGPDEEAAKA